MPKPPQKKESSAKCPLCGSDLGKSPLGEHVLQQLAQKANAQAQMGRAAMHRQQAQRPQMMQQMRRPM